MFSGHASIYGSCPYPPTLTFPLQGILLSDDTTESDTDSDDSDFTLSREELHNMLRLHRFTRQHQSKFQVDREVQTHSHVTISRLSHAKSVSYVITHSHNNYNTYVA